MSDPLGTYVLYRHLTFEAMAFITDNQCMDFLSFTKQATYTPFATDGIVGEVNINATDHFVLKMGSCGNG